MKNIFRPNYLRLGIILIALLLSTVITLMLYLRLTPWSLELNEMTGRNFRSPAEFRDLNHDGFSEFFEISNSNTVYRRVYYILFYNYDMATIDQCNTREYINPLNVYYGDYTGDGYDECFIFTAKDDSVFLYVFNIIEQKVLIDRQFVLSFPQEHSFWRITKAELFDINGDSDKELLFTLHPGRASKPRGLYVFDLQKKTIINRFENQSSKDNFLLYDLTGDGNEEIIVLGKANGNGPKEAPYTDYKNWVFILDHNLKLKFPPLSYGAYPSAFKAFPVQIQDKPYLLIAHHRVGTEFVKKPLGVYLVDSRGRFERRQYFSVNKMTGIYIAVDNADNPRYLFMNFKNMQLARYDIAANVLRFKDVGRGNLTNMIVCDMDLDGENELLVESENGIQIFDLEFNLLAKAEMPGPVHLSVRRHGLNRPPEIAADTAERFYTFRVVGNPLFNWLPLVFIGLFGAIIGVLLLSNMALTRAFTFFNYFIYSIKHTKDGIILLKPNGHVYYFNGAAQKLLSGDEALKSNVHYLQAFNAYRDVTGCITESMQSGEAVQKDFIAYKDNVNIKGEIRVIPFKTKFNYIYAYLVEIKDFTEPVLSDRHRVWSRTVRKIAHDIKTPLGAVLLNLERIQQKIEDKNSEVSDLTRDDFSLTLSEIKRIQNMTRLFLKFSNLEAPNIQPVQLLSIVNEVLEHFKAYLEGGIAVDVQLETEAHTLYGDARQLEMAIQILIENAIDALKGKGNIRITSQLAQYLDTNFEECLEIEIADNGPGIPEFQKDQIFEPFFSTKKDGTGMGLTIARKIIQDHNGEMDLISKTGYGTVFRLTLPAKKDTV